MGEKCERRAIRCLRGSDGRLKILEVAATASAAAEAFEVASASIADFSIGLTAAGGVAVTDCVINDMPIMAVARSGGVGVFMVVSVGGWIVVVAGPSRNPSA